MKPAERPAALDLPHDDPERPRGLEETARSERDAPIDGPDADRARECPRGAPLPGQTPRKRAQARRSHGGQREHGEVRIQARQYKRGDSHQDGPGGGGAARRCAGGQVSGSMGVSALRSNVAREQPAYVSGRLDGVSRQIYERVIVCGGPKLGSDARCVRTMSHMLETGVFWYGDNLEVMREHLTSDGEVDLIYLDPPFNSQRSYNMFFKEADDTVSQAQRTSFDDYWRWRGGQAQRAFDEIIVPRRRYLVPIKLVETMQMLKTILGETDMMAYLAMMAVRLVEMRRLLKPTGSIYLHCDPTASHYLKMVLDALFGPDCFRNEIIWRRTGHHTAPRSLERIHDTILCYGKTEEAYFNPQKRPYMRGHVDKRYTVNESGMLKFTTGGNILTGSGLRGGESGEKWRGFDPTKKRRHWAIPGYINKQLSEPMQKKGVLARLDALYELKLIEITDDGEWPQPVKYLGDDDGEYLSDLWTYQPYTKGLVHGTDDGIDEDVAWLGPTAPERTGYETQKPIGLLQRIIRLSCPPDGIVLDPFCGCGTAVVAAQGLRRRWIGIDLTHLAVSVLKRRMDHSFSGATYRVRGEPEDAESARRLAHDKPLEFQAWIVDKIGGIPVGIEKEKKVAKGGGDDNRDGFLLFRDDPKAPHSRRMLISVKGGESYINKPEIIDALAGAMPRHGATLGLLLMSHKPSDGTYKRAAGHLTWASDTYAPKTRFPKIQVVTVDDIFSTTWRGILIPGENTSLASQPPPGTPGASEELFDATGQPRKSTKPGVKKRYCPNSNR